MTSRQMKEREESLLSILGYKKFTQEVNSINEVKPEVPHMLRKDNSAIDIHSQQLQNNQLHRIKVKKQISQKYMKTPLIETDLEYGKKLLADQLGRPPSKNYFLNNFYNTGTSITPKNQSSNENVFSSELPQIKKTGIKFQFKTGFTTNTESSQQSFCNTHRNTSASKPVKTEPSQQIQQPNTSNNEANQMIQDIFVHQQQMLRVPTPYLTQQANSFSRTRKSLLLQLNQSPVHLEQMKKKLQSIKESTSTKITQTSVDSSRGIGAIFKDQKLNIKATSNQLQKAKMLSPSQLEEISNFSVTAYVSPRGNKSQKRNFSEEKLLKKGQVSHLLNPLSFKQSFHVQINKNEMADLENKKESSVDEKSNLMGRRTQKEQNERLNVSLSPLQKNTNLDINSEKLTNVQSEYQPQQINQESVTSQKVITEPFGNSSSSSQQIGSKWRFKNPVNNQPSDYFVLDKNNNGSSQNINLPQPLNSLALQHQPSIATQILNKQRSSKFEPHQIGLYGFNQQNSVREVREIGLIEQTLFNSQQSTSRIAPSGENIRGIKFEGLGSSKNIQYFGSSNKIKFGSETKQQSLQKHKTQVFSNAEMHHNKEKKRTMYQTNKDQNKNTLEFIDQLTSQNITSKSSSSNSDVKNQFKFNANKPPQITQKSSPLQELDSKRNSVANQLTKSPKSTTSPIKRRLFQQQIHEDNYIAIHQGLVESLHMNEVLTQYIEQSGYSIEIFSFYMMKLYNFCVQFSTTKKHSEEPTSNNSSGVYNSGNLNFTDKIEQYEKPTLQQKQEFPTLKVNEQTLISILEIFTLKMKDLQVPPQQIRGFREKFMNTIKQFMPQTFIDDLGGIDKIKLAITKLLEHLCYENGIISSFDHNLINFICDGTLCLLRSDQTLLEPYLSRLKKSAIPISNAEFYLVKVALGRVMKELYYPNSQICQIIQRLGKQRGFFFAIHDFSKDNSFRNMFVQSVAKNKKIIGYFLDPSQTTIQNFYDQLFTTLYGHYRYIDLIDFFEHKLKTSEIPLIMIDEIQKVIIETLKSAQIDQTMLILKDLAIKFERIKQKAGLISFSFLNIGMETNELVEQLIEWCEYALININLPDGIKEDSIIKPQFFWEYFFLVLSPDEQMFSIYDLDYAINYHNLHHFDYTFNLWLQGVHDILSKNNQYPKEYLKKLISYLRLNSLLSN